MSQPSIAERHEEQQAPESPGGSARPAARLIDHMKVPQGGTTPIRVTTSKGESGKPWDPWPPSESPFGDYPMPEVGP